MLSQTLPGLRFFLSRLGCRCSPLGGGDLEKRLDSLRSLGGVATAGGGGGGDAEVGGTSRGGCVSALEARSPARLGTGPWVAEWTYDIPVVVTNSDPFNPEGCCT